MTHNRRAWSIAALVAGCMALLLLACNAPPEAPESRGIMQPRGGLMTVTATPNPRATLWSPMEVLVANATTEGWNGSSIANSTRATVVAPGCVTDNCWSWIKTNTSNAVNYVYWRMPTPYVVSDTSDASLHISFDIKVIQTPSAAIDLFRVYSTFLFDVFYPQLQLVPRSAGNGYNSLLLTTKASGAAVQFDMTDNQWHRIDVYADQQLTNYDMTKTPQAGEQPFALSVDGTPVATPTGRAPGLEYLGGNILNGLRVGQSGHQQTYQYAVDNFLAELCKSAAGTCVTPAAPIYVAVTMTNSPTPTPTATATRTPVATRPTATPTVSPTPWGGVTCPTAAVTVDASLADWAAIAATPMLLSAADASYIWPAGTATPSAGDLSGAFKCAHSSTELYVSGVISDSLVMLDGDAAQVAVDGWGDGFLRLRADDHQLLLSLDGRLRDLATLPITATVATTLTVAGWQFELGIPRAGLDLPSLTQRIIGLVFGLYDLDHEETLDHQMISPTRTVLLQ